MQKRTSRQTETRKAAVFPLRIPAVQYERITEAASLSGDSIAAFIRVAAMKAAERALKKAA